MKNYLYIPQVHSTNAFLKEMLKTEKLPEFFSVRTAFQTAGKGQQGNSWESEKNKNLLLSIVVYPHHIAIDKQFIISQLISVSIVNVLNNYLDGVKIKWPNDIYAGDKKLGGILIENSLRGPRIEYSIIGFGLNVNQTFFKSSAPNPVSLQQLLQKKLSVKKLFLEIKAEFINLYSQNNNALVAQKYHDFLYRKSGEFMYREKNDSPFPAQIMSVEPHGELILLKSDGTKKGYYFKEVEFVI